jgi:uncharacterized repeat protein (TIGR04042 family)
MPEVEFTVAWPDGSRERCYSPSRAILDHFSEGTTYPLPEFLTRARKGLNRAAERVNEVHGFVCPRALAQLQRIEQRAGSCPKDGPGVTLVAFHR